MAGRQSATSTVQVHPAALLASESAALVQDMALALTHILGAELDHPGGVVVPTAFGVDDLQPTPLDVVVHPHSLGPRPGMPASPEVLGVAHGEGAEAGPHQRQRSVGNSVTGVQRPTAVGVASAGTARATLLAVFLDAHKEIVSG